MFRKRKKLDVLNRNKISMAELDKELKVELAVLGGLDIFTDAHVVGVANYTQKICESIGFKYETTKKCMLAAYLHDVGKIKIPSYVLQKQGKLTDEEYEIMKMHTIYGYEIVMRYDRFKYLAPIVRGHHENLDGSGYPDGLKKNQISEETKLIKIADLFDALTQRRQYKEGFKASKAAEIILEGVKEGKTGSKYLYYLLLELIYEYKEKNKGNKRELYNLKQDIETLKDLDSIYKKIYDNGYNNTLARKLNKYNLSPGYDMTTNANLLSRSLQKKEILEGVVDDTENEIKLLKKRSREAKRLIKFGEHKTILFGKRYYNV